MPSRIEDYALIGDCHTAALVSREGSIDWLCLPHFDSPACFAALVGTTEHGHWLISPAGEIKSSKRRYRGDTLILESTFETDTGTVTIMDCMNPRSAFHNVLRLVVGDRGQVPMKMDLAVRFDYGSTFPWLERTERGIIAIAGPDKLRLHTDVELRSEDFKTSAEFTVSEGQKAAFSLTWYPSHGDEPPAPDVEKSILEIELWWREWADRCTYKGQWKDAVLRSLITLKALTFAPTGAIVAAPTTSLPEMIGGVRNWDYRFCWVRDAALSLRTLVNSGYLEEAKAWREWLLRAVAGKPSELNIVYGLRGERRLPELELPWLPGYEGSRPVRIGNAAFSQVQLDVFGEIADTMYVCRQAGLEPDKESIHGVGEALREHLEGAWKQPDEGIWEVRGPRRHFTYSKVMAWVAMDRAVKSMERGWISGPIERWRDVRSKIHEEVCREGFNASLNSFVQFYGARHLDASLLMLPVVDFLPVSDPRVQGTVEAIEKGLLDKGGLVHRYTPDPQVDGLPHGEGAFLPCTFWLADNYALQGRYGDALAVFERLLAIRNDLGLLSEEYDPVQRRFLGNFPQAFSHFALVNTAHKLQLEKQKV